MFTINEHNTKIPAVLNLFSCALFPALSTAVTMATITNSLNLQGVIGCHGKGTTPERSGLFLSCLSILQFIQKEHPQIIHPSVQELVPFHLSKKKTFTYSWSQNYINKTPIKTLCLCSYM